MQRRGRLNGLITPVLLALSSGRLLAQPVLRGQAVPAPPASTATLERSWRQLDQQLRALDALIPPEPGPGGSTRQPALLPAAELPASLVNPNAAASGPLPAGAAAAPPPLSLPAAVDLNQGTAGIRAITLEQALAIAFAGSATLQAQRLQVAAALAELQASLGTWWPRISAVANGSGNQNSNNLNAPAGSVKGFGPNFDANGLRAANGQAVDGPFYVPNGGGAYFNGFTTRASPACSSITP